MFLERSQQADELLSSPHHPLPAIHLQRTVRRMKQQAAYLSQVSGLVIKGDEYV
jgi:hypothetical protein